MHVTIFPLKWTTHLAVGAATIWLLDLAIFCWEDVNLVIDLWSPPLDGGRVASKLFNRVILLWVGNLPVDLLSLFLPFTVVFLTVLVTLFVTLFVTLLVTLLVTVLLLHRGTFELNSFQRSSINFYKYISFFDIGSKLY